MPRALRALAAAALCALCGSAAFAAWRVGELAAELEAQLPAVGGAAAQVAVTLREVQREIPQLQASVRGAAASMGQAAADLHAGLPPIAAQAQADLQETHRLILEAGLTAMEARKASAEERAAMPGLTAEANAALSGLGAEMVQLQRTTRDLDALVGDPANAETLKSLSAGTASLAATAEDGQKFTHGLLHPSWPHKVWGVMLDVAHVFNPL